MGNVITQLVAGVSVMALLAGCASGHCRGRKTAAQLEAESVFVFKSDGSKQCQKNSGIKLADMAKTLQDIKILKSESRHDGKMRIQACGTSTGQMNVYEIPRADLEKAKSLGFEELPAADKL